MKDNQMVAMSAFVAVVGRAALTAFDYDVD